MSATELVYAAAPPPPPSHGLLIRGEAAASRGAIQGNNVLLVISLRGGIDGLSVVVPHFEDNYRALRQSVAVPTNALIARDSQFGLHPAMSPLLPSWDANRLAAVNAVGLKIPDRSHFTAMEAVEDADPGSRERSGWINRTVGLDSDAAVPTALSGAAPTLATPSIKELYLAGANPVVTISEFGRRVEANSAGGVDHGWGNMKLDAGGGVRGGQYYGSWPGLGNRDLEEGDLKVTTDYRNVLAEIVKSRFNRTEASVFPGLSYAPLNMMNPWSG